MTTVVDFGERNQNPSYITNELKETIRRKIARYSAEQYKLAKKGGMALPRGSRRLETLRPRLSNVNQSYANFSTTPLFRGGQVACVHQCHLRAPICELAELTAFQHSYFFNSRS